MASARFVVSGKVQGVFFRASTREEARRLHLTGHARNLADGKVEIVVSGQPSALDELERWLHVGPALAQVESLQRSACDAHESADFRVF